MSATRQTAIEQKILAELEVMYGTGTKALKQSAEKVEQLADVCFKATIGPVGAELR